MHQIPMMQLKLNRLLPHEHYNQQEIMKISIHQVRSKKFQFELNFLFLFIKIAFLSTSWRQLVAWMLNCAICLVCLVKLFVYGEPIVDESEMHEYYVYKKKADQLMAEVSG
jgi:hypothetical protein